jgi:hypothetical protein
MTPEPLAAASARLPAASADISYVEREFTPMRDSAKPLVERGLLPRATYVLPDGTPMVPLDHTRMLEEAGGAAEAIAGLFRTRYAAASGDPAVADEEYEAWLSGEYGACLYSTTPESIVAKAGLMSAVAALCASCEPENPRWRAALRGAVEALDALERPFAGYDRERFGGPTSRDRLITATRARFPDVFS